MIRLGDVDTSVQPVQHDPRNGFLSPGPGASLHRLLYVYPLQGQSAVALVHRMLDSVGSLLNRWS